jgi:hypothetical protein
MLLHAHLARSTHSTIQPSPIAKLAAGPAAATKAICFFGLRRRPKSTGTGLAKPSAAGAAAQHQRQQDGAERIDVLERVGGQAPQSAAVESPK